jgi:hypothetical protein
MFLEERLVRLKTYVYIWQNILLRMAQYPGKIITKLKVNLHELMYPQSD